MEGRANVESARPHGQSILGRRPRPRSPGGWVPCPSFQARGALKSVLWSNGWRLSCGALKKDSFLNLRTPSGSGAGEAAARSIECPAEREVTDTASCEPQREEMKVRGWIPPRARASGEISPQRTAFFTSAPILASSVAVSSFSAKATGHMASSSRFALSLKPNVAYLVLNFCALWKKQTTLPSLAYAGIPYQSLGERAGALALMIAWSRLPMARSGSRIAAIFASTALSPSSLSAFSSRTRSFIAARSSSVNPLDFLPIAVVILADFCVPFFGLIGLP